MLFWTCMFPGDDMAVKTSDNETRRAPRKRAVKVAAADTAQAEDVVANNKGARALIRAGLQALGEVRGDMVARQSRVFETLLGIGQSPAWTANVKSASSNPFGKFEDVFDQRVARSLERLGMPSPQALAELTEQVRKLTELLQAIEAKPRRR